MINFPEDILATAKREARLFAEWLERGNAIGHLSGHAEQGLVDTIALSLRDERNRSAKDDTA